MSRAGAVEAVVVAAGAGMRMGGLDKGALLLLGRPVLAWALDALAASPAVRRIIVVEAPGRVPTLSSLPWVRALDATVVPGGLRRQESVAAGVREADADLVLVHDGVRPLVSRALVDAVIEATARHGAAVPCLAVHETLKRVDGDIGPGGVAHVRETVDRSDLATAQTPQGARRDLLLRAFAEHDPAGPETFTDEASLLEASGVPVVAVPGEATNLKVTYPEDLARAEAWLAGRLGPPRVGIGLDNHPFGEGTGLALGGIVMEGAPRLHGHSDGDAVLHAVADGLLGAAALGDLGTFFPAGDPATRGIPSGELLRAIVARVAEAGYAPLHVDVTITAARPRLGGRLGAMRAAVAELVGLAEGQVSIKASSGNLAGYEGAGRGVAASAVVTLVRRWA
jgi:2-C-methyl-D-erythritol 4-phosphate cytidylyltransferase / 2-C-methyl-D-erythritol 2,4-cyclodiphosphate synthase